MLNKCSLKSSNTTLYSAHTNPDATMLSNYEISDDLTRVHIQCLERKYGGRMRAHRAATTIQRTYRHYRLFQQWKQVVSQAPNSSSSRRHVFVNVHQQNFALKNSVDSVREAHLRKHAQSQPSLKYQPMTSLTAQLRAERKDSSPLCSPTTSTKTDDQPISNCIKYNVQQQSNNRNYLELTSPRLLQRRLNQPYQKAPSNISSVEMIGNTTVVFFDSEHELESPARNASNYSGSPSTNGNSAYHRSASPFSHMISHDRSNFSDNNNLGFEESKIQDLFTSFPYRNGKESNPTSSVNWIPTKFESNQTTCVYSNGVASPIYTANKFQHSVQYYQLSPVTKAVNYNANSLPRMDKKPSVPCDGNTTPFFESSDSNIILAVDSQESNPSTISECSNTTAIRDSSAQTIHTQHQHNITRDGDIHLQREEQTSTRRTVEQQSTHQSRMQMRACRDLHRRRLYRIALNFFNRKPDRGIQLLIAWGFIENNSKSIARIFLERRGLSKQKIGEFLGTVKSAFHTSILECFIEEIPMYDMDIDKALRQLLALFRLPGEAQKIDHIMQIFARRYRSCNPHRFSQNIGSDTVYILAFAIIMLNTDLHTPSLKDSKRMKVDEFIKNICGIEEGRVLDRKMLQGIYERVKSHEFRTSADHVTQVMKVDQSIIGKDKPKLVEPHRRLICYCRLNQIVDSNRKQAPNAHQREIFLFNDLMVVAKIFSKKKNAGQYTLRYWTQLIGIRIESFQNSLYNFGLTIKCLDGQELIFNAKNADDRIRFMADVRESVLESTEMEQLRIELEWDKQNISSGNNGFCFEYDLMRKLAEKKSQIFSENEVLPDQKCL